MVNSLKQYKWSILLIVVLTLVISVQLGYAYGVKKHKVLNTPHDCIEQYFKSITDGSKTLELTDSKLVNQSIKYKLPVLNYTLNSTSINKDTAIAQVTFTGLDINTIVSNLLDGTSQDQSYSPSALLKKWTKALDSTPLVSRSATINLTVVDNKWEMSLDDAELSKLLVGDLSDNISKLDELVLSEVS